MTVTSSMISSSAHDGQPLVELRGVVKRFGGTLALNGVDLQVGRGEVVALVGENGAGKSTIIKLLAGVYKRDGGEILVKGESVPAGGVGQHVAFVHQDLGLVPSMTVAENMAYGSPFPRRLGLISWRRVRQRAKAQLEGLDVSISPDAKVSELEAAERALVAILRATANDPEVLVLDEPTATLSASESEWLLGIIRTLRQRGVGMLYVSHYLEEVLSIADRVVALRDGSVVLDAPVASVDAAGLTLAITGRELAGHRPPAVAVERTGAAILAVKSLVSDRVGPVSFQAYAGEICFLTGLVGAGQRQLGRALIGQAPLYAGGVTLHGMKVKPKALLDTAVTFASGNRPEEAIAPNLSVLENLWPKRKRIGGMRPERIKAVRILEEFNVIPRRADYAINALSGGNQQKVIIARMLQTDSPVMLLEDPTNGVDVGAKADIYEALRASAAAGRCIVVVTTDFEEAAALGARVLVFRHGHVVRELAGTDIDEQTIANVATGLEK